MGKESNNKEHEKNLPSVKEGGLIDSEELARALKIGNLDDSLNYDNLKKAAEEIFGDGKKILSKEDYQNKVVQGNYDGFDLESHGAPSLIPDLTLLTRFFSEAVKLASVATDKSNKILVMGCGPGRMAIPIIELAGKFGIEEVVFNDLLESHVDRTRDRVRNCYNTEKTDIEGVKLDFKVGDFIKVSEQLVNETREKFDAIISMWFVTSEICDFSSLEALEEIRSNLYFRIKELLTRQGGFIEDNQYSEAGSFYYNNRLKTYSILHEMGILEGKNDQMILSNFSDIQKGNFYPYHVRFTPPNGSHKRELNDAGLEEHSSSISLIPKGIRDIDKFQDQFGDINKIQDLFGSNGVDELLKFLYDTQNNLLVMPNSLDQLVQKKKTVLWRPTS